MRITTNMIHMTYTSGNAKSLSNLLSANERVTAGRNMLNPEDDPTYYVTAYSMQIISNEATQFKRNAENAVTWLDNEDSLLQSAYDYISKARNELAVAGRNDSQNAESRKALAGDVLSILNAMKDIGNSKYLGRYVFAGYQTQTEPFVSGDRQISAVVSSYSGAEAITRKLYGDMPELTEGSYTANINVQDGVAYISMTDSRGKSVLIDSNASDDTTTAGNLTTTTLVTDYNGEGVINTGVGVGIKLPSGITSGQSLKMQFYYKPGNEITYVGDDGKITTKIASNQEVTINVSGRDTFMETYRTTKGTMRNTVNGLPITNTTKFSQIDGANASLADSISFTGTDHNGYKIGTARVSAPGNVTLDMTKASASERTITVNYANRDYDITLPQKGYSDVEEIIYDINRGLDNHGIGGEMTAVSDGDKIMFISNKTGEGVELSVTGSQNNKLGFKTVPVTATGMDTTFETGYNSFVGPVTTTHNDIPVSAAYTEFYVQGKKIGFTPAAGDANSIQTALNQALMDAGMGFDVYASVSDAAVAGEYDISFKLMNTEYTNNTSLATKVDTGTVDAYQFSTPRGVNYPTTDEKRISDMLTHIEGLYGNAVEATVVDGKLQVKDMRSGTSKLTFGVNENNSGIGYPEVEQNVKFSGYYSSKKDDTWNVTVSVGAADISVLVKDKLGNVIFDNTANPIPKSTYNGDAIDIGNGVSIQLGDMVSSPAIPMVNSFEVQMKASSNLSFGDLNVTEKGENVNVFKSLENLYFALNMNIPDSGIGAPSSWKDTLNSTAVPYLDGEFRGNYNDLLNFEVQSSGLKSEYYIQKKQEWTSEKFNNLNVGTVGFEMVVNTPDGKLTRSYSSSAGSATAKLDDFVNQINNDTALQQAGVRAYNEDGKLRIDTGSGANEISVNYNNDLSAYVMGMNDTFPGNGETQPTLDLSKLTTANSTLDINYYDGGAWQTATVTVPNATYATNADLIAVITPQLPAGVSVAMAGDVLSFTGPTSDIIVSGDQNAALGFQHKVGADTVASYGTVTMDLSQKTAAERTLTFSYNDGTDKKISIEVDAENFMTYDALVANINSKLAAAGLGGVVSAEKVGVNGLGFSFNGVTGTAVSGDYNSTLGFSKAGDAVKIKVTGTNGELVNSYSMDTAGEKYYVADGVYQYYDPGFLYATDSFSAAVGSGIEYELDVLQKAESQVLTSLTTVGNNTSKTESAVTFNANLKLTTEEMKAKYTGSTTIDQTKAAADLTVAETAYQYALKTTSLLLNVSLLDYL